MDQADVIIVVPPFDSLTFAPLGPAVLAASLRARGIGTALEHGSVRFAAHMGFEAYNNLCNTSTRAMIGERVFLPFAYDKATLAGLGTPQPLSAPHKAMIEAVQPRVDGFLDDIVASLLARKPRIVGFSSTFQQTMSGAAIARRIKALAPEVCIVFGGANFVEPMGSGLLTVFPWIDHVFSGESDFVFPDFCESYLAGTRNAPKVIVCQPVEQMDKVASPDFSDFFAQIRPLQQAGKLPDHLPQFVTLESSRGCWWGAKHHCTFCGLNSDGMAFRQKQAGRVLDELQEVTERWGVGKVHFSDNIMPLNFLRDVFPILEARADPPALFYEVKANLREEQLLQMMRGGVRMIQPGIESLSSNVLRLMRKGVSALQNVVILRICTSIGMDVVWNVLYGFPGEKVADYDTMLALMPKIIHVPPPSGFHRIVIDRFSPYHFEHEALGIGAITPAGGYQGLYPVDAPMADIAYHFAGDYQTDLTRDAAALDKLRKLVALWALRWVKYEHRPRLEVQSTAEGLIVFDSRKAGAPLRHPLSTEADAALRHFEYPRPRAGNPPEFEALLDELIAHDLIVMHEDALLSVVARPSLRPARLTAKSAISAAG